MPDLDLHAIAERYHRALEAKGCGTRAGYLRHRKAGEEACAECRAANAEHTREAKLRNSARCQCCGKRRTRRPDGVCGVCRAVEARQERRCAAEGCDLVPLAKGYCGTHYAAVRRNGKPEPLTLWDRVWAKVQFTGFCWEWTAERNRNGHGRVSVDGQSRMAHRVAYELLVGPIPAGLELDHLCRNRACVNPDHLDPVTHLENMRRGFSPSMITSRARRAAA